MNDRQHLYKDSEKLLKHIGIRRLIKPEKALQDEIRAHSNRAMYYMANDDERYFAEIEQQIALEILYLNKYGNWFCPEQQNELIVLSLSVNRVDYATDIGSLDVDYSQSHTFDISLNYKLRKILKLNINIEEPSYKPLRSEKGLFEAMDNILSNKPVNWSELEKYWKATRLKRYEYTVFRDKDLFSAALCNAESTFNKRID